MAAGEQIAAARARHGFTHTDVGRRAGVDPVTAARVERGDPGIQLNTLCAVGEAVGLDIVVRIYPGREPSLRDRGQLAVAHNLCALLDDRWQHDVEVAAGDHGEAADLVLFGPSEIIVIEIDRLMLDFQEQYRRIRQKCEWLAARHQRPVRLVMAIEDTRRNRRAIEPHRDLIASALPRNSREVLASLRSGEPLGADGLLWIRRRALPQA